MDDLLMLGLTVLMLGVTLAFLVLCQRLEGN